MHELVLVICDLYLAQETPDRELPAGVSLRGLHQLARFSTRAHLPGGWRTWLSEWLTGREPEGIATVAAMSLTRDSDPVAGATASTLPRQVDGLLDASAPTHASSSADTLANSPWVWMATPVHLMAGLSSVHLDRRSILHLSADDQAALASEFQRVFHDSGFYLQPLDSGDFLLLGPKSSATGWSEPSRAMGADVADARRARGGDSGLRRLGAEIEMWLHEHTVNAGRARRGEAPVTGLWLWGGGPRPGAAVAAGAGAGAGAAQAVAANTAISAQHAKAHHVEARHVEARHVEARHVEARHADMVFGTDAFLQGLARSIGQNVLPLPPQLADVFSYPHARRAALVIEIGPMLHSHPTWTFFDALAQIDRDFIAPAIDAIRAGRLDRLTLLANDRQLTLRPRDRFKVWRRTLPGLSGLQ